MTASLSLSRAPSRVTRGHRIPSRGAEPDLHSPAFALMAATYLRSCSVLYQIECVGKLRPHWIAYYVR